MVEVRHPKNIDELEVCFDEALLKLKVYELPLLLALKVSLAVFEESLSTAIKDIPDRFSAEAAMLHHKCSFEILIPNLFKRCGLQELPQQPMAVTNSTAATVTDALNFCGRYYGVVHSYTHYHD
ncbi:hypothetical protein ACFLTP_10140 [Chloroflexota bacterium]